VTERLGWSGRLVWSVGLVGRLVGSVGWSGRSVGRVGCGSGGLDDILAWVAWVVYVARVAGLGVARIVGLGVARVAWMTFWLGWPGGLVTGCQRAWVVQVAHVVKVACIAGCLRAAEPVASP